MLLCRFGPMPIFSVCMRAYIRIYIGTIANRDNRTHLVCKFFSKRGSVCQFVLVDFANIYF